MFDARYSQFNAMSRAYFGDFLEGETGKLLGEVEESF